MEAQKSLSSEVIRRFREERRISQAVLANGIMSRQALNKFETRGTSISSEKLFSLLDRMNVTIEEYLSAIEYRGETEKKEIERKFIQCLKEPAKMTDFLDYLSGRFHLTDDPYYRIKFSQFTLEFAYINEEDYMSKAEEIDYIKNFLNRIEDWGVFELTVYSNCLFIFESEYIINTFRRNNSKIQKFVNQKGFKTTLYSLIDNCLILFLSRNEIDHFEKVLPTLFDISNTFENAYQRILYNIFKKISVKKTAFVMTDIDRELSILNYLGYEKKAAEIEETLRRFFQSI